MFMFALDHPLKVFVKSAFIGVGKIVFVLYWIISKKKIFLWYGFIAIF